MTRFSALLFGRRVVLAVLLSLVCPVPGYTQPSVLCSGTATPLDISFAFKPFVRMKLNNREGNVLIDTGATNSSVAADLFGVAAGSKVEISGSSLPTVDGGLFRANDFSKTAQFGPAGGHAASIGTDILSSRTVEFHYEAPQPYLVLSKQQCTARQFEDAGFVSILQKGFRATDTWRAWAESWLLPSDRINLPVIYIQIGAVRAQVWFDSGWGYGTSKHAVVIINDALLQQLRDQGVAMNRAGSSVNFDCQGNQTEDELWQVNSAPLLFTAQDGRPLFEYSPPTLQVRHASPCGTIGNRREPLGTVGALFLARWGAVVLDGAHERIWVTGKGSPVSPRDAYRGIALARNEAGGWSLAVNDSLENAKAVSLASCNEKYGDCKLVATVPATQFLCLAVAKSPQNSRSQATSGGLAAARRIALETCAKESGAVCNIEYSGCND